MKKSELKINTLYTKSNTHRIGAVFEWMGICNGSYIFRVYADMTTPSQYYLAATENDITEMREIGRA